MVIHTVAGVLLRDRHPINIHIVAFDLDVAVLVVVRRQLDVVHVGHGGGQVFAAILGALGSDLIRGVMIIFGKGVGVVVVAPDVVFIAVHGCGGNQVHHTVFAGAVNIVAAVIAGSNVAVQAAALEVERTAAMAQAAALGGIVGGDVAAVYSQGAVALAHTAAAFGGFVAGNVTAAHQAVAAVYVPAGAIDGLIAADDYILRGMGVAKQQAAAAVLVHAAAAFGTGVAGDAAAGQGHGAARLVDRAIFAGIAADLALGHGKLSAAVVGNVDDTVLGCAVVGDRTALQRVDALGNVDCTAVAAGAERCILKDAAVGDDRVIGLGKAAVDDIYRAAAARLAAGDGAAPAKGEAAAAVHADRTAAVRRTAVGDGGIGHSDVGIVAQQQCAAVGSGAADGAAADNGNIAFNGQGGFAADARDGMARQIQRDIGVLADLGAGVGIGQQLDSQLLGGLLRQHGAGGIHSLLQAVVNLARFHDLRDLGFHLGHAQGQGVSALDGVVVDGFIFQGLAGILVQPVAIVVDGRCLGQVQHGIGLGLVGIHILAQLGAVVFHRAVRNLDDEGVIVRVFSHNIGADAAAVLLGNIIRNGSAGHDHGLFIGGMAHVVITVLAIFVAFFRLDLAGRVDAAAIVGRVVGDGAVGQAQAAFTVLGIIGRCENAAALDGCRVAADDAVGCVQRTQAGSIPVIIIIAAHADTAAVVAGVIFDGAVLQVDNTPYRLVEADAHAAGTAGRCAVVAGNVAVSKGNHTLLLVAKAIVCKGTADIHTAVGAAVVTDGTVLQRDVLLTNCKATGGIRAGNACRVAGNGAARPGAFGLDAACFPFITVRAICVWQANGRIIAVFVVGNGHVGKGAGGGDSVAVLIQRTAAIIAQDTALALGLGDGAVTHHHAVAIGNVQQCRIAVRAAIFYGVVIKNRIIDFQQVIVGVVGIHIHGVAVSYIFHKAAMVDPHIALGRAGGTCADINGRGRVAVGRNVAIKQHIAHVFGSAAAHTQCSIAAAVVAVAGSVIDELGVVAALRQGNALLIADGEQVAVCKHGTAAAVGLIFLKPVVRAQGQGAIILVDSAASVGAAAVIFESTPVNQIGHINVARVYTYRAARTVSGVVFKGVVLQHYVIRTILFAFSLFRIDAGLHVDCTAAVASAVACKGVAA